MNVREEPKNCMFTNGAQQVNSVPPISSIHRKSALRPLNEPSSRDLLYLMRKNMWNTKSRPRLPKNMKFVSNRHTSPFWNMSLALKYILNGDIISRAHPAVVRKESVMYTRVTGGSCLYQSSIAMCEMVNPAPMIQSGKTLMSRVGCEANKRDSVLTETLR